MLWGLDKLEHWKLRTIESDTQTHTQPPKSGVGEEAKHKTSRENKSTSNGNASASRKQGGARARRAGSQEQAAQHKGERGKTRGDTQTKGNTQSKQKHKTKATPTSLPRPCLDGISTINGYTNPWRSKLAKACNSQNQRVHGHKPRRIV